MLGGGGLLKCDWVIEMLLYLSLEMGMLKCDWDVEMLLYLSPEMESVVFVQIFFSIYIYIYIYIYFILWLIYIGTKCYVEMLITWIEHVITYSFWFNTYTCVNARIILCFTKASWNLELGIWQ